jgi:hypothetical protein
MIFILKGKNKFLWDFFNNNKEFKLIMEYLE